MDAWVARSLEPFGLLRVVEDAPVPAIIQQWMPRSEPWPQLRLPTERRLRRVVGWFTASGATGERWDWIEIPPPLALLDELSRNPALRVAARGEVFLLSFERVLEVAAVFERYGNAQDYLASDDGRRARVALARAIVASLESHVPARGNLVERAIAFAEHIAMTGLVDASRFRPEELAAIRRRE